nr:MAG TPA: MutS domain I [Caudoviricetes sp.]
MSKLLNQYESLKKIDPSYIYIFRVGIFYNILNEDAKILNEKLNLKITNLSPEIFKCGFPVSTLDKYKKILNEKGIKYKIIDNLPNNMNTADYMNNVEIKHIISRIKNLDMNNTTFQQAFNILLDIQNKLKNIQ